jgi:hypothetical protein
MSRIALLVLLCCYGAIVYQLWRQHRRRTSGKTPRGGC